MRFLLLLIIIVPCCCLIGVTAVASPPPAAAAYPSASAGVFRMPPAPTTASYATYRFAPFGSKKRPDINGHRRPRVTAFATDFVGAAAVALSDDSSTPDGGGSDDSFKDSFSHDGLVNESSSSGSGDTQAPSSGDSSGGSLDGSSTAPSGTPDLPLFYSDIVREFPYFFPMMPVAFDECYDEFTNSCLPALRKARLSVYAAYQRQGSVCMSGFCKCLPAGAFDVNGHCRYEDDESKETLCHIVDDCMSSRDLCFMNFLNNQLPGNCSSFMSCTVTYLENSVTQCKIDIEERFGNLCSSADSCSYLYRSAGSSAPSSQTDPAAADRGSTMSQAIRVGLYLTVACMALLGVLFIALIVRHRRMRLNVAMTMRAAGDGGAMTDANRGAEQMIVFQEAPRYFGVNQLVVDLPAAGNAGETGGLVGRRCVVCGKPFAITLERHAAAGGASSAGRVMLLPCRDEWCGCQPAAPLGGGGGVSQRAASFDPAAPSGPRAQSVKLIQLYSKAAAAAANPLGRPSPSSIDGPARSATCAGCQQAVECAVDLTKVYNAGTPAASSGGPAAPSARLPLCVICLEGRAEVALLPCGHVTSCSTCSRALQDAVPRRVAGQSNTIEVSCQCPICRTRIVDMVLLDESQLLACVDKRDSLAESDATSPVPSPRERGSGATDHVGAAARHPSAVVVAIPVATTAPFSDNTPS